MYFKEYKELDSTSLFFFIFGCSIALFGIALLSGRDPDRKETHGEIVPTEDLSIPPSEKYRDDAEEEETGEDESNSGDEFPSLSESIDENDIALNDDGIALLQR